MSTDIDKAICEYLEQPRDAKGRSEQEALADQPDRAFEPVKYSSEVERLAWQSLLLFRMAADPIHADAADQTAITKARRVCQSKLVQQTLGFDSGVYASVLKAMGLSDAQIDQALNGE